jgi:nitrogen regulatory protein PII
MQKSYCALTVIVHITLLNKILKHLDFLGITRLYSTFGRSALLSDDKGFWSLFKKSDLAQEPVQVLYFYIPLEWESLVMKSIVKVGRFEIPGRGSVFSKHIELYKGHDFLVSHLEMTEEKKQLLESSNNIALFSHLTQINCTLSKGLADDIAKLLLLMGIVPVITNASGSGLRDQLGLIRFTIPRDKELLTIVVGRDEGHQVMSKIISWGKLDRPGRGFIWQTPVEKGVINLQTSRYSVAQAASTEQIIAAIDSLKGNFFWRQGTGSMANFKRHNYFRGKEIIFHLREGEGHKLNRLMNHLKISGATVEQLKTVREDNNQDQENDTIVIPREIIRIVIDEKKSLELLEFLERLPQNEIKEEGQKNSMTQDLRMTLKACSISGHQTIRAFNFRH